MSLRYDQSKRQARTCRNLNPEVRNMATLYQIRIQNQREQKQLATVHKGLEEQQKLINAEHTKEKEIVKRDLARLNKATDRQGKYPKKDFQNRNITDVAHHDSTFDNSRPESNRTTARAGNTSKSSRKGSRGSGRSASMFNHSRHQLELSTQKARNTYNSKESEDVDQYDEDQDDSYLPSAFIMNENDEYSGADSNSKEHTFIDRWKRLNFLVNSYDGKLNLPSRRFNDRQQSLSKAQERRSLARKEIATQQEIPPFTAEEALKVLNTRYLRLTKVNVNEMEKICLDEGIDVEFLHTHVDEEKNRKELMRVLKNQSKFQRATKKNTAAAAHARRIMGSQNSSRKGSLER